MPTFERHERCAGARAARHAFALPEAETRYAPDRPGDLIHLRLELKLDLEQAHLEGVATHTLRVLRAGMQRVRLDLRELAVSAVRDGAGRDLSWHHEGGVLEIHLVEAPEPGAELTLSIGYAGHPRLGLNFIRPDADYPDRALQAWTQGQDEYASYWFPCHDFPNARATTELIATVDARFQTISNGTLVQVQDNSDATRTWHWREGVPHVAYLVSLVVGEFDSWSAEAGTRLEFYVPPGRRADGERAFAGTDEMVRVFGALTGEPYPFEKYAQVVVRDFTWGGMENTSATTLYDGAVYDERGGLDYRADELVAHELAHQWFGDLITCREWAHGWLNEGFATYFEQVWLEHRFGADEAAWHREQDRQQLLAEDRRYRRPVVERRYAVPGELFDSHLYEKGGWVLWMLRNVLGEDNFKRSLRAYVARQRLQHVTTDDLQKACEDTTGLGLGWFFEQWLMKAGHPEFKVRYSWDAESSTAHIEVEQTQATDDGTPIFRVPLAIAFGGEDGALEIRTVDIRKQKDGFDLRLASRPRWVSFDHGERVLKTLDFDRPVELLIAQLREGDVMARAEAARALGSKATPAAVAALTTALGADAFWGVQAQCAASLGEARTPSARDALLASLGHPHPKVRRAVAQSLGAWRGDATVSTALRERLAGERAYTAIAALARALGTVSEVEAVDALTDLLEVASHQEAVRAGAVSGLRLTRAAAAVEPIGRITRPPFTDRLRRHALSQLGALGRELAEEQRGPIRRRLEDALHDPLLMVRLGACQGLEALGDRAAIPALESLKARDPDGKIISAAGEAVRALRDGRAAHDEIAALRDDLDRLQKRESALHERLEKLEAGSTPA